MIVFKTDVNKLKERMDTKFHLPQYDKNIENLICMGAVTLEHYIKKMSNKPLTEFYRNGDILISNSGEGTVGKAAIDDGNPIITPISKDVIRVQLSGVNPYYILLFIHTKYGQMQIKKYEYGSSGITHIGQQNLKCIYIPEIDMQIQSEIEFSYKTISRSCFEYAEFLKQFKLPNFNVKDTVEYRHFLDEVDKLEKLIENRLIK